MDSYRGGQLIAICDICYRPRRLDEEGWTRVPHVPGVEPRYGRPAAPYKIMHRKRNGVEELEEGITPAAPADFCPEHQQPYKVLPDLK